MNAATLLLDQSLGEHYHAKHLGKGGPSLALARLKRNIECIQGLREVAQTKLTELEALNAHCGGAIEKRCAISAQQLECLREALRN